MEMSHPICKMGKIGVKHNTYPLHIRFHVFPRPNRKGTSKGSNFGKTKKVNNQTNEEVGADSQSRREKKTNVNPVH